MAAAVIVAALVIGVAIAALAGGDDGDGDFDGVATPTIGELPTFDEPDDRFADDDLSAPPVAPTNQLVEGEGAEFDTDRGTLRIVAARLEAFLPGFETPVPPGSDLEILSITFEPADGGDPGPYSEVIHDPDPRLRLAGGGEAVLEAGGLLHSELFVAFTIPTGARSFTFEYPGSNPITLVIE